MDAVSNSLVFHRVFDDLVGYHFAHFADYKLNGNFPSQSRVKIELTFVAEPDTVEPASYDGFNHIMVKAACMGDLKEGSDAANTSQ